MKTLRLPALMILLAASLGAAAATKPAPTTLPAVDIPYEKFVLANGLTLIVHEDHKAPIVAVNIWYHVGSKDERPGRTGFAHLFEHLMFNGSENYNDDFFRSLEPAGATKLNGTTWLDRTNYFQNVPTSRARPDAVAGVRSHGPPARRHRPEEARRAARRGAEREAPGREPALRQGRRAHHARAPIPRAIRIRGKPSARWKTSTRPRSRT